MKTSSDQDWQPDPHWLAAYFDGELEGSPDTADLRARLEAWLEKHPEALIEAKENQRLRQALLDTAPPDPSANAWNHTLARIHTASQHPVRQRTRASYGWKLGACAAGVALFCGLLFGIDRYPFFDVKNDPVVVSPKPNATDDQEPLLVATASEIVILRIEGADTSALVVGLPPLHGSLELAAPGEIRVLSVRPDAGDRMLPLVQDSPNRPMIWARLDTEED